MLADVPSEQHGELRVLFLASNTVTSVAQFFSFNLSTNEPRMGGSVKLGAGSVLSVA